MNTRLRLVSSLAGLLLVCAAIPVASAYTYQLEDSFEQTALSRPPWIVEGSDYDLGNVTLQSDITRTGQKAVSLVNNYADGATAKKRTEMTAGNKGIIRWDQEYWIGFSFYLKNWTSSPEAETVHQIHGVPHGYDWSVNSGRNLSTIYIKDGVMSFKVITTPFTGASTGGAAADTVWSEPVQSDVWQDWVIHVRPSSGSTGLLEAWKNGALIYRQTGGNVDPYDAAGLTSIAQHYLKVGVYNWPWMSGPSNVTTREVLYDEVRIGSVNDGYTGGYTGVAPNGGAITFTQAGDVSEAFPTGIIQGGESLRGFDATSLRLQLYAKGSAANHAANNANAYSAARYSAGLNFIPEGRTITFNDVTMQTQATGQTNLFALGIGNAATGNFTLSSGPAQSVYFIINRNGGSSLQLMRRGVTTPLATWTLAGGSSWSFDYLSLTLTAGAWSASVLPAGQTTPTTYSGTFATPYTTTTWGGNFYIGLYASQVSTSDAGVSRFTDGRVGSIEISPIP